MKRHWRSVLAAASAALLAACATTGPTYYSKPTPAGAVKTIGVFVASDGGVAGRPAPDDGNARARQAQGDQSETPNYPACFASKEWNKPMALDTELSAKVQPCARSAKMKLDVIPVDSGAAGALANALKAELKGRGYAVKTLDFGSADKLTVSQVVDKAKEAGCDSVLVAEFHLLDTWKSQSWSETTNSGNTQTTTTRWFNFQGVNYSPRVSMWSADKQPLWVSGNLSHHRIEKATKAKVGFWESKKADMSRTMGSFKAMGGKIAKVATLGAKGDEMQKAGEAQANEKSPEQKARENYEDAWKERLMKHAVLTGTAVSAQAYSNWLAPDQGDAKREQGKAMMAMLAQMSAGPMGGIMNIASGGKLQDQMATLQKKFEEESISRPDAIKKAAKRTADELFNPTTDFIVKEELDENKPFPWAARPQ